MRISKKALLGAAAIVMATVLPAAAANTVMQLEYLDRGAVAVKAEKGMLVTWRALASDPARQGFDVYRDGRKLNAAPITARSNFVDEGGSLTSKYEVRTTGGVKASVRNLDGFLNIPLDKPADGKTPTGANYTYSANDASVGDVDGDGDYEIILKWDPSNARDNSGGGYTGNVLIDAYTLEGKRLWRINLGRNIRAGAHYTQFQVADYDGDGKAELVVKTADGTVDGAGKVIGDANADWVEKSREVENRDTTGSRRGEDGKLWAQMEGRIVRGPEYLSVFEGATGKVIDTVPYASTRGPNGDNPTEAEMAARWGDSYANRSDRYNAGTAWLDGVHPSVIMQRGYYGRTTIAAFDLKNKKLVKRWYFDSQAEGVPAGYSGMGNHQMSVADVDGDGKHEIVVGSMALDDDGKPMWTARLGHGDAMHLGDLDPYRPGLEKYGVHESMNVSGNRGSAMLDARTGEILWSSPATSDTGRGASFDIDPRFPGSEAWMATNGLGLFNAQGKMISQKKPGSINFAVWWDGDLTRELLDSNRISKWNYLTETTDVVLTMTGTTSNNGSKSTPALSGDLFGDWREEVMLRTTDNTALHIYSTNIPTEYRFTTLMHDPQYRAAIAWQNSSYNQPPHPSFAPGYNTSKQAVSVRKH